MAAKDIRQVTPEHVAIIMDGNGRWATRRGMPRLYGHRSGARRVREIVKACPDLGVRYLTLYAFSTENWKRSPMEVDGLMTLFRRYIASETQALLDNGVRVRFIGDRTRLDPKLVAMMQELEQTTACNELLHMTIALNYGARDELTRASVRMADAVRAGKLAPQDITDETISGYLDTADLPDPDLVIRTSGENRVSNFLLWQSAYAEYVFTPVLWPDFDAKAFDEILMSFSARERRFGAVAQ
ncbi:MAG: isoprenyl transferase [Mangrovicoccus sp.]|nr:isoprenyl transferase [Mangrovicoccus sp.]